MTDIRPEGSCLNSVLVTFPFFVCVLFLAIGNPNVELFHTKEVHDPLLSIFENLPPRKIKEPSTDNGQAIHADRLAANLQTSSHEKRDKIVSLSSSSTTEQESKSSLKEVIPREGNKKVEGSATSVLNWKKKPDDVNSAALVEGRQNFGIKSSNEKKISLNKSSAEQSPVKVRLQDTNKEKSITQEGNSQESVVPDVSDELYRCLDAELEVEGAWPIADWTWKQNDENPSKSESTIAIKSKTNGGYCWEAGRKFTWEDAVARLKGKHLIIFGDSVTRYQYMSLVYFLENKKWPDVPFCEERLVCSKHWPHKMNEGLCNEKGEVIDMWTNFYILTSKYLKHEKMECFRHGAHTTGNVVENRYFRMGDVSVTFFRYTKHGDDFHGTWKIVDDYPWFDEGEYNCPVCECPMTDNRWRVELNDTKPFAEMMKKLHPTHVVFNMGFWGPPSRPTPDDFKSLFHAAKVMPETKFIWKTMTCTHARRTHNCDDQCYEEIKTFRDGGFLIYDAYRLSSMVKYLPTNWTNLYFDAFHFTTPVYTRLNEILLSIIF